MISFVKIDECDKDTLAASLGLVSGEDREYLYEVCDAFLGVAQEIGAEVAVTAAGGCLAVRIFDEGRYLFPFPVEVSDSSDTRAACLSVSEYARRELLPLYFSDVPREELSMLGELFSHIDARAYDGDEDLFGVSVNSECASLDGVSRVTHKGVTLDGLADSDREAYAALCSDSELNRWWGYDADADNPERDPDLYLKVARDELAAGIALTLAVRLEGAFAGEAVIYDFDYTGGASVGIRVLPEYQGRGVGSRALEALIKLSRDMGLSRIRTSVMEENIPSVTMTDKHMRRGSSSGGKINYYLDL